MSHDLFAPLVSRLRRIEPVWTSGEIVALSPMGIEIEGLGRVAALGDAVGLPAGLTGDILTMSGPQAGVMVDGPMEGLRLGQRVRHLGPRRIAPDDNWIGRIIDPDGKPLDGRPLDPGPGGSQPERAAAGADRAPVLGRTFEFGTGRIRHPLANCERTADRALSRVLAWENPASCLHLRAGSMPMSLLSG